MTQQVPALADLHKVRPAIYWADLLLSAGVGWISFAIASSQPLGSPAGIAAIVVAIFALYRALAFTHEISHQRHRIPYFEAAWNWLVDCQPKPENLKAAHFTLGTPELGVETSMDAVWHQYAS